jgi:hypothetical protein
MSLCRWTMSGSMICSIPYTKVGSCKLVIFQHTTENQQSQVAEWLLDIFEEDFKTQGLDTIPKIITFIKEHWQNGDSYYVFIGPHDNVLGAVGIDLSNNEPFLSNMFIIPNMRKYGYSKILLKYAEIHSRRFEFNYIKLWCNPYLLDYYSKFGFEEISKIQNSKNEPVLILMKKF